jgi:class 3 adenylate cyclase
VLHGHVVTKDKDRQKYAEKMCKLAKELVQVGNSHISRATGQNTGSLFGFKAGLHAGPLSSGILGRTRRFYKIFGDTVVMAARLSQNAKFSTVQISQKVCSQ